MLDTCYVRYSLSSLCGVSFLIASAGARSLFPLTMCCEPGAVLFLNSVFGYHCAQVSVAAVCLLPSVCLAISAHCAHPGQNVLCHLQFLILLMSLLISATLDTFLTLYQVASWPLTPVLTSSPHFYPGCCRRLSQPTLPHFCAVLLVPSEFVVYRLL